MRNRLVSHFSKNNNQNYETSPIERILRDEDFADNTIETYSYAVHDFMTRYKTIDRASLSAYKLFLINTYKPATVNIRILSLNKYMAP